MLNRFEKYLEEYKMLDRGEQVVVGVSGGADSVCLLLLLNEVKSEYGLLISAVHINHGIRGGEADRDEDFVRRLCGRLGIECRVFRENIPQYARENGLTEEEAGRKVRYIRFAEVCRQVNSVKLAVAHNADDHAETVLFNIIRGSSLSGLCGIRPVSTLEGENGISVIRPLLDITKKEITKYLISIGEQWCEDSTNSEEGYSRNYIRNTLMPAMEKMRGGVSEHIRLLSCEAREAEDFIRAEAERLYLRACSGDRLDIGICESAPAAVKKELIYRFITEKAGHKKDIHRIHVLNVLELLKNQVGKSVDLPYDITVRREYGHLYCCKKGLSDPRGEQGSFLNKEVMLDTDRGGIYSLGEGKILKIKTFSYDKTFEIPSGKFKVWFDADKIGQQLVLRVPCEGDYFCSYADGRKKKLARLFIDEKIPREEREGLPVIAMGHRCLWIPGLRRDEAARIGEGSKRVLEFTVEKERKQQHGTQDKGNVY